MSAITYKSLHTITRNHILNQLDQDIEIFRSVIPHEPGQGVSFIKLTYNTSQNLYVITVQRPDKQEIIVKTCSEVNPIVLSYNAETIKSWSPAWKETNSVITETT